MRVVHRGANGSPHPALPASSDSTDAQGLLLRAASQERECRYTVHLDFTASDPAGARELVAALAEGLGILRPEIEAYSARLSAGDRWAEAGPVFCLAGGPKARSAPTRRDTRAGTPRAALTGCAGAKETRRGRRGEPRA